MLIQRCATGNALPEERRSLKLWLGQDIENKQCFQDIKEILKVKPAREFDVNAELSWERFSKRLSGKRNRSKSVGWIFRKTGKWQQYSYQLAAIILVSLFTGLIVHFYGPVNKNASSQTELFEVQELITNKGEKARVTFSDGTEVILNSASSLKFPEKFQDLNREVYLDGEAYFKVARHTDQPFIVHTQDAEVEVLGTEFNVRGWSQEQNVEVVVREGRVSVYTTENENVKSDSVILNSGDYTTVEQGSSPAPPRKIDFRTNLLWLRGGMHFENVPFDQVLRDIERRFNVETALADAELKDIPFSGTFEYAELEEVLSVIASAMNIEYTREGFSIEFK